MQRKNPFRRNIKKISWKSKNQLPKPGLHRQNAAAYKGLLHFSMSFFYPSIGCKSARILMIYNVHDFFYASVCVFSHEKIYVHLLCKPLKMNRYA